MRFSVFCLLLLSVPALLPAQTRKLSPKELPASAFKLIGIKVTGTTNYTPADVIAASGLAIGQTVSEDDFRQVSQHLAATGAFSDVLYSFQYATGGTRLELQLTDSPNFLPARFDNFVWLSDSELQDKIHAKVPLFKGTLPVAGDLPDQVSDALQALLIEHNVNAKADYLRYAAQNEPISAFIYTANGIDIHIREVSFEGADPGDVPALQAAAKRMPGGDYRRSAVLIQEQKDLLPVYLARGYLKAQFGDPKAHVVAESPNETSVDITIPVVPGRQYVLKDSQFSGNQAFPQESLQKLIHLQPGQPANAVQLQSDLEAIKKLYGTRGYMAATIKPEPDLNDEQAVVSYTLSVSEGDVYKMGELEIVGLDSRTRGRLEELWKLRGGDTYDTSYPERFLKQAAQEVTSMGDWNIKIYDTLDQKDHLVDVTLRFDPR